MVEGVSDPSTSQVDKQKDVEESTEATTVSVHADSSYSDALVGFTEYDSKEVDTDAYSVKRQAYDNVRQRYPNVDDLIRDEKVQALKELKAVGFRYYSIRVTAFVKKDGETKAVRSKTHHRLERPSKQYLQSILAGTFKGSIRAEGTEAPQGSRFDNAGNESPNVSNVTP